MFTLKGESARSALRLTLLQSAVIQVLLICLPVRLHAECNDPIPEEPVEAQIGIDASQGCVAMHEDGDFVIAYHQWISGLHTEIRAKRYCRSGDALGSYVPLSGDEGGTQLPSIAASRGGHYHVAWLGVAPNLSISNYHLLAVESEFDEFPSIERIPNPIPTPLTGGDGTPSAGASDAEDNHATAAWSNSNANKGLHASIDGAQGLTLRDCDTYCSNRKDQWRPCVATRSEDGIFAVVFAYDENPDIGKRSANPVYQSLSELGMLRP